MAVAVYEPYANSDGFPLEWSLFIGGLLLGLFFWLIAGKVRTGVSEKDRRRLFLAETNGSVGFQPPARGGRGDSTTNIS